MLHVANRGNKNKIRPSFGSDTEEELKPGGRTSAGVALFVVKPAEQREQK